MAHIGEELVAAFDALFGAHAGFRAAHAKGTCCEATFVATPEARAMSKAPHFSGAPTKATVRFSNGSGDPTARDNSREPRGMAVKFHLPDGGDSDIVGINQPVFIVRTPEDFLAFMDARRPDPATDKPDMQKLIEFLGAHPEGQRAAEITMAAQPLASFLQTMYHAIHAFRLVNDEGDETVVRYRWEPHLGVATITPEEAKARGADYLRDELIARLAEGPARFTLHLQVADATDDPADPTAEWPADRRDVIAGTLTVERVAGDDCHELIFDPTRTCEGIKLTKDKILMARSRAYRVSSDRRLAPS